MSPSAAYEQRPASNGIAKPHGFGTRAVHVGSDPDQQTGAVIRPISLSTHTSKTASASTGWVSYWPIKATGTDFIQGYEYSRSGNPNRTDLETTLASLESGGAHAIAFSSGSATTATIINALGPDSHILSVNDVYGGTYRYITRVAAENQGVQATFFDLENDDDEAILAAFRPNTKVSSPRNTHFSVLTFFPANLGRNTDEPYPSSRRCPSHCQIG